MNRHSSFVTRHSSLFFSIRHSTFDTRHSKESGAALLAVCLTVSVLIGVVVAGLIGVTMITTRAAALQTTQAVLRAEHTGGLALATAGLAERLQISPPVTASDLSAFVIPHSSFVLHSSLVIEDEGGKLSWPFTLYALQPVLDQYGVGSSRAKTLDFAGLLGLTTVAARNLTYPHWVPPINPTLFYGPESVEEAAVLLSLTTAGEFKNAHRYLTPCRTVGLNLNTAGQKCVAGMMDWHRRSALTYLANSTGGWFDSESKYVYTLPLPSPNPVVTYTAVNFSYAEATIPETTLFPTESDPDRYWRQLVNAWKQSSFMKWVGPHPTSASPLKILSSPPQAIPGSWLSSSYAVSPHPWFKFNPAGNTSSVIGGRPYGTGDVTQPLALAWYTPEAWFSPMSPIATAEFAPIDLGAGTLEIPQTSLDMGLSAAAFTGWLSLQGPGPYRVASDWYTLSLTSVSKGVTIAGRVTCRIFPDALPIMLIHTEEE